MEGMLQAVEAPVLKLAAVAAAVAAGAAFAYAPCAAHDRAATYRLVLEAPELPHAIYLTAWHHGDVFVTMRGEPRPITFKTKAYISDGCHWMGIETLTPAGSDHYAYTYDEEILSCEPGAIPAIKTPRTGTVTIVPAR
jgi:hypothetical protein